jgi:hypothetical protein
MSITGFLQAYVKPSRWWRRQKSIEITVWPRFLAQAFCPHIHKQLVSWDNDKKTRTDMCIDCHKWVTVPNECMHAEVTWASWDTDFKHTNQPTPLDYRCLHCGVLVEARELIPGTKIQKPIGVK